ncbi:hypothetical protein A3A38_00120 [Candidatus Kaiserbacteria bacterium RIFCSPLOWO2_01_FULL_53_17]|uniref:Mannose-6-phosphate isomerase type II C-terminal domain-containing protein n=1 Tax=Candidatus Kaiserbacteria bacterium RIFCSPLOWO2_01_FULL_53_17 TaxID=1798511 RepID=A0A1F6EG70_9BACT|nr:MAG: hypothetical protein A3A38_00120 [Candidatus Kaiserbacteria bacterium RIFCSPLOWO2_01_FULL_53_17]
MTKKAPRVKWVAVSGGFDPLHIGHVRLFKEARKLGDKLVVILNNDNWLVNKKGFVFMTEDERKEVIEMFPFVDKVVLTDHAPGDPDMSVVHTLVKIKPAIFANGGDRDTKDAKREASPLNKDQIYCRDQGIKMIFGVGRGGKMQSSSWLLSKARRDSVRGIRPWGQFYEWDAGKEWYVKTLYIEPGKRLSLQYHHKRSERWVLVEGDATAIIVKNGKTVTTRLKKGQPFIVRQGETHRLASKKGGIIVEVALGSSFDESDIIRLEDDHGRATT